MDTVNFWLPNELLGADCISNLCKNATNLTKYERNEVVSHSGNIVGNYKFNANSYGVSFMGSLCKFYHGHNFGYLSSHEMPFAVEMLSDALSMPMHKAKVTRLDFARTLEMDAKPKLYYDYLSTLNKSERSSIGQSLYYSTAKRVLCFYDKIAESKAKSCEVPIEYLGLNLLRYELRFMNKLPGQFNVAEITGKTISNPEFYKKVSSEWQRCFEEIIKNYKLPLDALWQQPNLNRPKDVSNALMAILMQSLPEGEISRQMALLREKKVFDSRPEYYSRLKSGWNDIQQIAISNSPPILLQELIEKVKAFA